MAVSMKRAPNLLIGPILSFLIVRSAFAFGALLALLGVLRRLSCHQICQATFDPLALNQALSSACKAASLLPVHNAPPKRCSAISITTAVSLVNASGASGENSSLVMRWHHFKLVFGGNGDRFGVAMPLSHLWRRKWSRPLAQWD